MGQRGSGARPWLSRVTRPRSQGLVPMEKLGCGGGSATPPGAVYWPAGLREVKAERTTGVHAEGHT